MRFVVNSIEKLFTLVLNYYKFGAIVLMLGVFIPICVYIAVTAPVAAIWFVFDSIRTLNWIGLYFIAIAVGVLWWMRMEDDSPLKIQVRRGRTVVDHAAAKEKLRRVLQQRRSSSATRGGSTR